MKANDYAGLVAPWKVELIVIRAKRMRFHDCEIEDAQQEIIFDILAFRYDPTHPNGATERSALTSLIDNRLRNIVRARMRYRAKVECVEPAPEDYDPTDELQMAIDVRDAVAALDPRQQRVCADLADGYSRRQIARRMGCGWHRVNRLVDEVRDHFRSRGLGA